MLSVIIPARTEQFLNKTIEDVLKKATGEIEMIVVLDGYGDTPYEKIEDKRVKYISFPLPYNHERRKRQAVNAAVSISRGKFICWMDAHCAVAEGFDEVLAKDCADDWVVVPRRRRLSMESWEGKTWENRPCIDYTYWIWRALKNSSFKQYRWDSKARERKDIMIDDIITTQASFFFMTRKHFDRMRFMKVEGYMGWGQEGEEICLTTILKGGRAVVNKNTWYAHLLKKQMKKRQYKYTNVQASYDYSYGHWVHEQKDFFIDLINKNMPIPNYPADWAEKIYGCT